MMLFFGSLLFLYSGMAGVVAGLLILVIPYTDYYLFSHRGNRVGLKTVRSGLVVLLFSGAMVILSFIVLASLGIYD